MNLKDINYPKDHKVMDNKKTQDENRQLASKEEQMAIDEDGNHRQALEDEQMVMDVAMDEDETMDTSNLASYLV
ncbi:hypothetical protein HAX54_012038 [Datura stramonium]|uniref:Uncharacterized protein n=1 Tax=Datura stramonium TaxID=4076 RepID=A0ABS8TJ41_DATST|nr:hypothetical protein [Datura stramonium]